MMKALVRLSFCAGGLSFVFAAGARAQEIAPTGIPDSRVSPVLNPTPGDPILSMHIGYGGAFNSSVANGDLANTISGGVARQWLFHRGEVNISGSGGQSFYSQTPDQNPFTFDVAVSGSYQISRRAQVVVSDRIASGFAWQSSSLTEAELALPNAIVTSNGLSVGYGYDLSRKTRFQVGAQYDNLIFDDSQPYIPPPNVVDQALLRGTDTFAFHTSISHLLSHADSFGVSQGYSRQVNGAEQSQTITLHGTWQRPLSPTYNLSAEGGVDTFVTERLTGLQIAPTGSVTISRRVRKTGSLAFNVEQHVEVMGATHISTSVNIDGGMKVGKRMTVTAQVRAVHTDYPADSAYNYNAFVVGGTIGYSLPANLVLSASSSNSQRHDLASTTEAAVNGPPTTVITSVSLSYAKTWR